MMIRRPVRAALAIAFAMLVACRQGDVPQRGALQVNDAWARATAPGQETAGVFLTIRGGGVPDRLTGGSTDVARTIEFHTMRMDGAVARMRRQAAIDIPADGTAMLQPGGTHVMLVGLGAPLAVGKSFELRLDFAKAKRKEVTVKVLPIGATGPRDDHDE